MAGTISSLVSLGLAPKVASILGGEYSTVVAAGSAIADATGIGTKVCVVTGANAAKGVQLPEAGVGELIIVKNADNANLLVYPASATHKFNGGTAAAAVTVAAYAGLIVVPISATDSIAIEASAA